MAQTNDPLVRELSALAPFPFPGALGDVLVAAYGEGRRAYHTLRHVLEVAKHVARAKDHVGLVDPASVFLAILFHDAVYDATAKDNEEKSADLLAATVHDLGLPVGAHVDRARALVLATASHGTIDPADDTDMALFLDADMAILGADEVAYDAYEAGVAYEYAEAYPPALYRQGRAAFLAKLVEKPRLYFTPYFHDRKDGPARENLRRAIAALARSA